VLQFLREGAWYQLGMGSSLLRDNLHLLIIGPLFGSAWVGYYAWGLQLCMMASQVFVQISARVSVPIAAQSASFPDRWRMAIRQVGLLTAITAPILAGAICVAPAAIHQLFADKWRPALVLLPYLFLRMLPGAASAPIGALTLVERGARIYTLAMWLWTAAELGMGMAAVRWLGVEGLAISYSIGAWVGIACLLLVLKQNTSRLLLAAAAAILGRPTLWASVTLAAVCELAQLPGREWLSRIDLAWTLVAAAALVAGLYAADSDLRSTLLRIRK
jgi:O-antigen/teichoic acid export membrane protein